MKKDTMNVSKNRVKKMLNLAFGLQNEIVELVDVEEFVSIRDTGLSVSDYLKGNISESALIDHDIDTDTLDQIFTVKQIGGNDFTLVNTASMIGLSKETVITYIFNLENLKELLKEKMSVIVDSGEVEVAAEQTQVSTVNVNHDVLPSKNVTGSIGMSDDVMEQYLLNEIMNSLQGNPMLTITLMQKKSEGKLTRENLMKLATHSGGMGYRANPMNSMMMMQILNSI